MDTGPWRKQVEEALRARDWIVLEQVVEEAVIARQPPSRLLSLVWKTPYESAICLKLLRRIRQAYPGDFWANRSLAVILHYYHGQPEEAIRYYTAALALRPHTPATCADLGNALKERGEVDGAIAAYRDALDVQPDYAGARFRLVEALAIQGDADGIQAALHERPGSATSAEDYLLLGNALFRNGYRDEAIASFKQAVALDPKVGMAHFNLATALLEKKECLEEATASFRDAITCQRRATELNPTDGNNLAWFLATCPLGELRDPAEAVKRALKAVELVPRSEKNWNTLGAAYYRAENWKEAIAALEKSMQLSHGGTSYDYFFLAMAHWQLGDKEKARQWFDKGVQWTDKNMPNGKELGRFRAEAAELLKVESKKHRAPGAALSGSRAGVERKPIVTQNLFGKGHP